MQHNAENTSTVGQYVVVVGGIHSSRVVPVLYTIRNKAKSKKSSPKNVFEEILKSFVAK